MATAGSPAAVALRLSQTYQHPRERVFRAWTEARALTQWFAPSDEYATVVTALDVRPGGNYRIEMRHSGKGTVSAVTGIYREVLPPAKLVFTWAWESKPPVVETLVTVEFVERGRATEVVLTHERLPNAEEREKHEHGWRGCLGRLEKGLLPDAR